MVEANFKPVDEQLAYIRKGTAEAIPEEELKAIVRSGGAAECDC